MKPRFFPTPGHFRRWLEQHHATESELWVGFHKKGSGRPSITWPESVDEALCFGWIDGIRKALDEESYVIRFTPRRPTSNWSKVNIRRVGELERDGRMRPAGQAAFAARDPAKSGIYLFEQNEPATMSKDLEKRFRANKKAWSFFEDQPPGYRKLATRFVMGAKREETRERRLERLIADSAAGRRIGILQRPERSGK
jgi:uncharacterized protein YdeI (YjbR/CyaY-like superfamily)